MGLGDYGEAASTWRANLIGPQDPLKKMGPKIKIYAFVNSLNFLFLKNLNYQNVTYYAFFLQHVTPKPIFVCQLYVYGLQMRMVKMLLALDLEIVRNVTFLTFIPAFCSHHYSLL